MKNLLLFLLLLPSLLQAQSLPVGSMGAESLLRRYQLFSKADSIPSLTIRPLLNADYTEPLIGFSPTTMDFLSMQFGLFPIQSTFRFHSHHPYPVLTGPIIPAAGPQSWVSVGFFLKWKIVSLQLKPEFIHTPQTQYEGFPQQNSSLMWASRYNFWNRIDVPETFGTVPFSKLYPGQSSARINYKNLSVGLSTENLWWGPGKLNSLILSNNAPGFFHFTASSIKPVNTPIGTLEWQYIGGNLKSSGYVPPDTAKRNGQTILYVPKHEEDRYLSGLIVTIQPFALPGFFLGYANTVQQYQSTTNFWDLFSSISSSFSSREGYRDQVPKQQLSSFFMRWLWPDENAEIYFEYAIQNPRKKLRHFLEGPNERAFLTGLSKQWLFTNGNGLEAELELTHTQFQPEYVLPTAASLYTDARIRQGYTHQGKVLGAGTGNGTNLQSFAISWLKEKAKIGLNLQRVAYDKDMYYYAFSQNQDYRKYWVDYTGGISAFFNIGKLILDSRILYTKTLNYHWQHPQDPTQPFFSPGKDVENLHFNLGISYKL